MRTIMWSWGISTSSQQVRSLSPSFWQHLHLQWTISYPCALGCTFCIPLENGEYQVYGIKIGCLPSSTSVVGWCQVIEVSVANKQAVMAYLQGNCSRTNFHCKHETRCRLFYGHVWALHPLPLSLSFFSMRWGHNVVVVILTKSCLSQKHFCNIA